MDYGCCKLAQKGELIYWVSHIKGPMGSSSNSSSVILFTESSFKEGLEADNLEGKKVCRHGNQPPTILILEQNSKVRNFLSPVYAITRCSHCYHFPGLWRHSLYAISAQATSGRQASGCRMGLLHLKAHTRQCRGTGNFFRREHVFLKTGGVFCRVDSNKAELASAIESIL